MTDDLGLGSYISFFLVTLFRVLIHIQTYVSTYACVIVCVDISSIKRMSCQILMAFQMVLLRIGYFVITSFLKVKEMSPKRSAVPEISFQNGIN